MHTLNGGGRAPAVIAAAAQGNNGRISRNNANATAAAATPLSDHTLQGKSFFFQHTNLLQTRAQQPAPPLSFSLLLRAALNRTHWDRPHLLSSSRKRLQIGARDWGGGLWKLSLGVKWRAANAVPNVYICVQMCPHVNRHGPYVTVQFRWKDMAQEGSTMMTGRFSGDTRCQLRIIARATLAAVHTQV